MKKSELVQHLRCNLWGTAKDLAQAQAYLEVVISDLPKDCQGDMWIAVGVAMNTLANEIEKLKD
jgi:hypothetical protein